MLIDVPKYKNRRDVVNDRAEVCKRENLPTLKAWQRCQFLIDTLSLDGISSDESGLEEDSYQAAICNEEHAMEK